MKKLMQPTFLILALSFFVSTLHAIVGPVVPGQSIWCIDQRISSNLDIINNSLVTTGTLINNFESVINVQIQQDIQNASVAESSLNVAVSLLNLLDQCISLSVATPTTITQSGVYCLNNNVVGTVAIQANDVLLSLNSYEVIGNIAISGQSRVTVQNGVVDNNGAQGNAIAVSAGAADIHFSNLNVKNASGGIILTGVSGGTVSNCQMILSGTGISIRQSNNIVVQNCTAMQCSQIGFNLITSTTNSLLDCTALATGFGNTRTANGNNTFGFSSNSGYGNIFERCIANGTQALTTTDFGSIVTGFGFFGTEQGSKIINCEASNTITNSNGVTIPYGIFLQIATAGVISVNSVNPGGVTGATAFATVWSPDGRYVAVGGNTNNSSNTLFIYQFNYLTRTLVQVAAATPTGSSSDTVVSIAWSPDGSYLLVANTLSPYRVANDFFIYRFDSINQTLTQLQGFQVTGQASAATTFVSAAWFPREYYFAVGGEDATLVSTTGLRLFKFDPVAQTSTLLQTTTANARTVAWSPDGSYVAYGGTSTSGVSLATYSFTQGATQPLFQVNTQDPAGSGSSVNAIDWSPNGRYLLVAGNFQTAGSVGQNKFLIYQFSRTTQTLTLSASFTIGAITVFAAKWAPDGIRLVLSVSVGAFIRTFMFDPGTPAITAAVSGGGLTAVTRIPGLSWSPDGQFIVAGGTITNPAFAVVVFQALTFPFDNVIKGNTVYCNSGGSIPLGVGISGSSIANMIVQNTAYANPINQFMVPTNYVFVQNVFNQQFAKGPSYLQNISLGYREPIVQPDDLELLLKQIKYEAITSACQETPITSSNISGGTISITASGAYCLSTNLTADMVISATCASVDLNNRILTGRVIIQQSSDATLHDGRVAPVAPTTALAASQAAITIANTAVRAMVQRVVVVCQDTVTANVAGRTGIELQGNDAQIIGCTIRSGAAGNSTALVAPNGGDGILVDTNAARGLITGCLIKTGAGGNSSANLGGNGGNGVNVAASTETKIIKNTIFQTGAGGTGGGGNAGGIGGHGVNVQDGARNTLINKLIIRDTGLSGVPESSVSIIITEGGTVTIPLRSRAINDLIPTTVTNGFTSAFANTAYRINDNARPYIFQSQLDTLSQGNPSPLQPQANEIVGNVVTGWSPLSNVVFQSTIDVLA